jgi:hypothetical protein
MEEVGEVWIQQRRRSVVPMVVPGHDGEGRADGAVLRHFNMEEERGADVEAHAEDMEEGAWWRRTRRRSGRQWVCDKEMKGLWFRGSGTLKKKNSSDRYDDVISAHHYI